MIVSRALRNCNPGNIRLGVSKFKGEVTPSRDDEFKEFEAPKWGYRAMFIIIHNYGVLYGIDTLNRIIGRWAPPSENDTNDYISVVARRLGVGCKAHINSRDHDTMVALVGAMAWIESGSRAVNQEIEDGWELFAESFSD
ncbi:MAG: structural protein P5 [Rikenellaceae bacterium]